jgi:UDP-N-acetylglucosamine acyltransferase
MPQVVSAIKTNFMIHPTAIIHPKAKVAASCVIGPYCVIGEHVTLGENCRLHSHAVVDGHTTLGQRNEIFPFAAIGLKTQDLKWKGGATHVRIGDDNVFREGVTVHSATSDGDATVLGSNNLLLTNVHIAHDCQLGNHIIMSSFAGLAGHVIVEDNAILAGYVAVHQFCRIGKHAMIGGCCKVRQDIAPFMLADGDPAKPVTVNKIGLERHGISEDAQTALRAAYKIIFREGLLVTNALARVEAELPPLPEIQHLVQFIRASERGISK